MAEDNNLVIQKNTFQTCFYEIQLNYDNAKLTNFVSKLSFGKDDQNMSTFFDEKNIINNSLLDDFKKFLITHLQIICEKIYNKEKIEISNSWFQAYGLDNQHEMHVHGISENSFELILRILGNEFIAIRIGSTNFSGKLIAGSILLLFFTFMLLEVFGLSRILGLE